MPNRIWAASQMYNVTSISTMMVTAHVPSGTADELKLQVIDVVTGKRVWIQLDSTSQRGVFEGRYQIDIKGKSGELPILQFSYQKKILFVKSDPKSKIQTLALYEREKDVPSPLAEVKALNEPAPSQAPPSSGPAKVSDIPEKLEVKDLKTQEEERMSMEAQEALRKEALLKQQQEMSEQEQARRRDRAQLLIQQASQLYAKGHFDQASQLFAEGVELDPSNSLAYYQYGVSLFKTGQYNRSLAVLGMAENGPQSAAEHNYYVALNHLKLQDQEKALDKFKYVRDENDPLLSATASFLAGNLEYQKQNYTDAKKSFEYTIDNSKDPEMDRQAEELIEEINRIETFNNSAKEKLSFALNVGASYDGNVVNISKQNLTTDVEAYRLSYGGSLTYKVYQTFKSDLSAILSASDMYSVDKSMKANSTLQSADPLVYSLSLPFRTQLASKSRSYLLNVTPTISSLTMNIEEDKRIPILQSATLATDVSFPINAQWTSTYKIEVNQDISFLDAAEEDDQSGLRTTLGMTQTRLLDPKATRTVACDLSYALNQAKGLNNTYGKTVFALSYSFPGFAKTQASVRGDLTSQKYTENTNARTDTTYSFGYSASKELRKSLSLSFGIQFIGNTSNVESYRYDKFLATSMLTYTGSLIKSKKPGP